MTSLPAGTLTKRLLVDLSHAIEQFALAQNNAQPLVVVALFQRLSYLMREVDVYRRIAQTGAVTVVGIAEDYPPALPAGIAHVLLDQNEPLAREWSVTVLGAGSGATLVATDLQSVLPDATTLEAGRQFDGGWSFLRENAYAEALRLRQTLGGRLHPRTAADMDQVLARSARTPADAQERRTNAALSLVGLRLSAELNRGAGLSRRLDDAGGEHGGREYRSGLRDGSFLRRWLAGSTTGTLPLGLLLLRVHDLCGLRHSMGMRAEVAALRLIGEQLQGRLRGAERAVILSDTDFLLLLPARDTTHLHQLHHDVLEDLDHAETRFPYIRLSATAVATVTRQRPLPLPDLTQAITDAPDERLVLIPG
jgi:DICT domain-containing protein